MGEIQELKLILREETSPFFTDEEMAYYLNKNNNGCGAGYNSFCITPEGNMIPCCSFHASFGNLKEVSVPYILSNSKELNWWRNLSLNDYEECGKHNYCDYCNLCTGTNYSEHGTPLKASENNCFIAKVRYNLASKMMNEDYDPLGGRTLQEVLNELPDYKVKTIKREINRNYSDMS